MGYGIAVNISVMHMLAVLPPYFMHPWKTCIIALRYFVNLLERTVNNLVVSYDM
jgi:hypothetical protein